MGNGTNDPLFDEEVFILPNFYFVGLAGRSLVCSGVECISTSCPFKITAMYLRWGWTSKVLRVNEMAGKDEGVEDARRRRWKVGEGGRIRIRRMDRWLSADPTVGDQVSNGGRNAF
ncbi:hypothetical protein FNV43_RR22761 [Rhamnella rubrinervis]|uniref:Uncharacterized protein n=1 Tax=Rhamnella rubrinervis TaxID=2594499 RepID=A0A8K0GVG4_9ROSA|nr:hypothetical protein FNV43_RR22761 [Rhamnella rubrinervis]